MGDTLSSASERAPSQLGARNVGEPILLSFVEDADPVEHRRKTNEKLSPVSPV